MVSRHHLSSARGQAAVSGGLVTALMTAVWLRQMSLGNHHFNNLPRISPHPFCMKLHYADAPGRTGVCETAVVFDLMTKCFFDLK